MVKLKPKAHADKDVKMLIIPIVHIFINTDLNATYWI